MVREGRVFISVATDPDFGSGYTVQALEVGAQVATGGSGSTVVVRAGHGFAAGDKWMLSDGTGYSGTASVTSVDATNLYLPISITVSAGDLLVNLANDGGTLTPSYNSTGLSIYSDMDYTNLATNRTVTADSNGRYRYYHKGINTWELVRNGGLPIALYTDAGVSSAVGPDSATDNAVARWDGTTGETLQNSVVTIGDTGAVTGITTLNASGAVTAQAALTVGTTLGVTGTSTLAAVNASGLVAAAAAVTVGTTLGVTGASTLTGGIAGGIPRNIGTWQPIAATSGSDTACSNGTAYTGSIFVPANMTITGVQFLVGSVGGTDKVIASLHNSTGTLLANSALAGATVGTAAQLQQVALTATYAAVGPAWYHLALTFNGTTAKFRTVPAYCNAGTGVVGNGVSQTFGTAATFTAPTTFTADKVPVASIY